MPGPDPIDPCPVDPDPIDPYRVEPEPIETRPSPHPVDLRALLATAVVFALPMAIDSAASPPARVSCCAGLPVGPSSHRSAITTMPTACRGCGRRLIRSGALAARGSPGRGEPIVPVVTAERAWRPGPGSGCRTAKVKVADPRVRSGRRRRPVAAVREALGPRADPGRRQRGVDRATGGAGDRDPGRGGRWAGIRRAAMPILARTRPGRGLVPATHRRRRVDPAGDRPGQGRAGRCRGHRDHQGRTARRGAGCAADRRWVPACRWSSRQRWTVRWAWPRGSHWPPRCRELPYACGLGTAGLLSADVTSATLTPVAGVLPVRRNAPDPDRLATVAAEPAANGYWLARLDRVAALLDADADRR